MNNLTTVATVEGKVLDARQGKVLKDTLDALQSSLDSLADDAEEFATRNEVSVAVASARPVISSTPPANPVDGQVWFKPIG